VASLTPMSTAPIEIHVIADSTGDTAARVARAAQAQFVRHPTRIVRHPRISTAEGLHEAFALIEPDGQGVAVFSTLVDDGLRELVGELCERLGVAHCDLLGPALLALETASGDRAERVPARQVGLDPDYFKRIAAMEFAVRHDDGQSTSGLVDADIVLIGVSRTGKTPLSMYLGYLGYKTANVPLVRGIPAPAPLFAIDRWKIVALTIDPERLATIRGRRVRALGSRGGKDGYAELSGIYDELDEVSALQRRLGCPSIDTTSLALEEAAGRVIDLVEDRRRVAAGPP
jgi:regulator of PEP synthase PpsR (kinase-PPPase family)